ncbi:hypothetical protein DKT74_15340, partial [Streptomyces sp. ZEA17I]|uniref:hypothetical protein n=1 Tax=Streptomyces sp. ZEA17I TaxID=2202516 RepID=UPI000D8BDE90
ARANQRAQRAAAKRAQAARAAARKAKPKPRPQPKSQPKPRPKPSQKAKPAQQKKASPKQSAGSKAREEIKSEARGQAEDAVAEQSNAADLASKIDVENLSMTRTVENHTWDIAGTRDVDAPNFGRAARPYMNGNNGMLLREIMRGSAPRMDSRGAPGVVEWRTPGRLNRSNGIWELNIDANSNRIVHFLFKSKKG